MRTGETVALHHSVSHSQANPVERVTAVLSGKRFKDNGLHVKQSRTFCGFARAEVRVCY